MSEELKVPSSLAVHLDDLFGDKAFVSREDVRKWARELCGELNSAIITITADLDKFKGLQNVVDCQIEELRRASLYDEYTHADNFRLVIDIARNTLLQALIASKEDKP